jgi:gamma-glutamylcyclotransferase
MSDIKNLNYFAYGSNLKKAQMDERNVIIYRYQKGFIKDYKFEFNKESKDGSSKANITEITGEIVWGVCFELDAGVFENLRKFEKGYDEQEVVVYGENQEILFKAITFISTKICDKLPTKDYLDRIVTGAKQHELPNDYIEKLEQQATKN